jgi:hypothetical protein
MPGKYQTRAALGYGKTLSVSASVGGKLRLRL